MISAAAAAAAAALFKIRDAIFGIQDCSKLFQFYSLQRHGQRTS